MVLKKIIAVLCAVYFLFGILTASESSSAAYLEACKAFSRGEWDSAELLLKKAVAYDENYNADTFYMLITAEVYAQDNKNALSDCETFLYNFPDSIYAPRVQYIRGKTLFLLGDYEKSIVVLSDFCHQYETDELYPSALFYIAESLYAGYKYDEAESLYERIVLVYSDNEKVSASKYRIESIAQRSREEKLLYLLKQTGEEYLAAKEEYEKQLRLYNSEAINSTREKLVDAQMKNKELEDQVRDLENQIAELKLEQEKLSSEGTSVLLAAKNEEVFTEKSSKQDDIKVQNLDMKIRRKGIETPQILTENQNKFNPINVESSENRNQ